MKYLNTENVLNILTGKACKVESAPAAETVTFVNAVSPIFE